MSGTVPGPALPSKLPHTQHIYCGHFGLLTPWSFRHVNSMVISVSYLYGHFSILYPEPCLYNQRVPRLPELLSLSNFKNDQSTYHTNRAIIFSNKIPRSCITLVG